MRELKIKEWRDFVKSKNDEIYNHILDTQIPNDKLTIEDIPDPDKDSYLKLEYFAQTYNTYNLKEFDKSEDLFHKFNQNIAFNKTLENLRSILFFHQRSCHHCGQRTNKDKEIFKTIIKEIRKIF